MKKIDEYLYLTTEDIFNYLRNRPPLLMIKEAYVKPGDWANCTLTTTGKEWYYECHFPGNPMMPGVLQLEMMFNTSALAIKTIDGYQNKLTNIVKIQDVIYKKHIYPQKMIDVKTNVIKFRRGIAEIEGSLSVESELCCKARFLLAVLDDVLNIKK